MASYAIISGNIVTNTIEWDGDTKNWQPQEGEHAIELKEGQCISIGDEIIPAPTPKNAKGK